MPAPIITFKAGICEVNHGSKPYKCKPQPRKGYIYIMAEDDLTRFCWRERNKPVDEPEVDLVMIPTDAQFVPYKGPEGSDDARTKGRIFVLKFSSSSQRHLFWLQSKSQARSGDPSWLSPRDLMLGSIVNRLLQGEEVDVNRELASVRGASNDDKADESSSSGDDDNDDVNMEDADGDRGAQRRLPRGGGGGAGPGATGGDVRREGEASREGGADGARATSSANPDVSAILRNFLESVKNNPALSQGQQVDPEGKPFPLLADLLDPPTTIRFVDQSAEPSLDNLLSFLPPAVVIMWYQVEQRQDVSGSSTPEPTFETAKAGLSLEQKRSLLRKVLRSPQFVQSLTGLTMALRDGGLASIAEALGVQVANGGMLPGGTVPLGGGAAVEAFLDGVKKGVEDEGGSP